MRAWRFLVWLVPSMFALSLGMLTWSSLPYLPSLLSHVRDPASFAVLNIFFLALTAGLLVGFLSAAAVAAVLARRGQNAISLLILGGISAFAIAPAFFPPFYVPEFAELFVVPGGLAAVVALVALPELRRANRQAAVVLIVLLLIPAVDVAGYTAYSVAAFSQECPSGPAIDLTFSGPESAHFSEACGPSPNELGGCHAYDQVVMLNHDRSLWYLTLGAGRAGTVTSVQTPNAGPRLIASDNTTYGGANGWHGRYILDSACSGTIDADLFRANGNGPPMHVSGRFVTW